jgi:predicted thioesterase
MSITIGLKGRAEAVVSEQNTAQTAGSGTLPVFATPYMCALMEKAAWTSLAPYLAPGESTVGTMLNIAHSSASPVGIKVWAESEVTAVDGKRIQLKVAAYDEKGLIGEGTHERFIVTDERFLAKTAKKLEK